MRVLNDAEALIADEHVDAVVIASHDSTHADLAIAAVAARQAGARREAVGAHRRASASGCCDARRGCRGPTAVDHRRLHAPVRPRLPPDAGHAAQRRRSVPRSCCTASAAASSSAPGATDESSIVGSTIHDLDVVPWLLDSPIIETSWHAGRSASGVDFTDPQVMLLRTADGALTTVETFLNAGYGFDIRCEIVGERGTVVAARAGPSGGRRPARPLRRVPRRLAAAVRRGLSDRVAGLGESEWAACRIRLWRDLAVPGTACVADRGRRGDGRVHARGWPSTSRCRPRRRG